MAGDDWMREGHWEPAGEMTPEDEARDRALLDWMVLSAPGPAYQWRTEATFERDGRRWRWLSDHPLSGDELPPLPPP